MEMVFKAPYGTAIATAVAATASTALVTSLEEAENNFFTNSAPLYGHFWPFLTLEPVL